MASERVSLFLTLSKALTGVADLNAGLAEGLLLRLEAAPEASALSSLLETYGRFAGQPDEIQQIRTQIIDGPFLVLSTMIIVLWYTGDLLSTAPSPPREAEYFGGLVWRVARAHPPGLSGGYFGHWTYPPDNA